MKQLYLIIAVILCCAVVNLPVFAVQSTMQYSYSDLNQLESAGNSTNGFSLSYSYDEVGNMETYVAGEILVDIKANSSDGPITISQGTGLSITINLDPTNHDGEDADWWVYADTPSGKYWYNSTGEWILSNDPILANAGPLEVTTSYEVLTSSTLQAGDYIFYFAIDNNMDGNFDKTFPDTVSVTIQ